MKKCPRCASQRVARILYGMPAFSQKLERDLAAGRVVLGGCVLSNDAPTNQCLDCAAQWRPHEMSDQSPPRFSSADPLFTQALVYASCLHAAQTRKSTDIPYISHLFGVASLAIEYGASMEQAIGALLHDAAEDCGGRLRLEEIRTQFGEEVAQIVEGCTDTFDNPKPDWTRRKTDYLAHLAHVTPAVRLVSAADKLHNARSILKDFRVHREQVFDRFRKQTPWDTVWYYSQLARAFVEAGGGEIAAELDRVVRKIEQELRAVEPASQEAAYARLDAELDAARHRITP